MLVLTRKRDERVKIGHDVTLTIVEIRGDKVRLGIEAPQGVAIHRQEVYEAIQRGEVRGSRPPVAEAVTDSPE